MIRHGKRTVSRHRITAFLLAALLGLAATGCGSANDLLDGGSGESPAEVSADAQDNENESVSNDAAGEFAPAGFRASVFDEAAAEGNDEVQVDLSHTAQGYISLVCHSDSRIKLQIVKDDSTYTYDVILDRPQVFPLQSGNGDYLFYVMKNLEDNKYFELYSCMAAVTLEDEFAPFVRPNQYADYTESSECVKQAAGLAQSASGEEDFVASVYAFICERITYDREKAATVASGYIPEPDAILSAGKGICFDYASLAASMLRSQGIPTKIIFGYVEPDDLYHAWNMFYTKENGWTTVEFLVSPNDWNRIDLTFAANGADSDFIGDGSNYMDVYFY